jgi:uncharacterized protein YjbJ (UPF0337 family)
MHSLAFCGLVGLAPFGTVFALGQVVSLTTVLPRSDTMSGKSDEVKGRVKEAAGAITDDDKLRREGKIDQAAGKTKQAVENAVDKVKDAVTGKNR